MLVAGGTVLDTDSTEQPLENERTMDVRGTNQSGMRAYNERLVLSLVRRHGALAKAKIARITGLSAQTVSVIMRGLEKEGLLQRGEKVRGKVGQPSIPMNLARDGAYFLGLKVGRRSADLVLVDFLGDIVSRVHTTYQYPTPDGTIKFVKQSVATLLRELTPAQLSRISGLGIATPFFIWEWASIIGVEEEKMAAWRHRDLKAEVQDLFDFPVFLENDATSACGAELVFGTNSPPPDFLYFYVGYFIGGGIVLNNRLYTGPSGNAGALGPMPLGRGNGQQLVDVASLAGLENLLLANGCDSQTLWESPAEWNMPAHVLQDWFAIAAPAIAQAIVSSISLIDFQYVQIDGWLPEDTRDQLILAVIANVKATNLSGLSIPEIKPGSVGPDARSLGAASLPLSKRFMPEG